jgi:putative zinc finger protein
MSDMPDICAATRGMLADRAFGELNERECSELEDHLQECAVCRAHAAELSATVGVLDKAPRIAASHGFDAQLARRLRAERDAVKQATVLAVMAAVVARVRRFQLGSAIYPLVTLAFAYVMWMMFTAEPTVRIYNRGSGDFIVRPLTPKSDRNDMTALAALERDAVDEHVAHVEVSDDPYHPLEIDLQVPVFVTIKPLADVRDPLRNVIVRIDPSTTPKGIENIPDPPIPVRLTLPAGGPGGTALARTRYTTIKNDKRYMRRAIANGLVWLMRDQRKDGSWTSSDPKRSAYSDVEITAAAALAYMQSGFTPYGNSGSSRRLKAALRWLVRQQGKGGRFVASSRKRPLAAQAMAVVALSEAMRLTDRDTIRNRFAPVVERAMTVLIARQSKSGSWGDAEVSSMALLAVGSARAAGVLIDVEVRDRALAWLDAYRSEHISEGYYAAKDERAKGGKSGSYAGISVTMSLPPADFGGGGTKSVTADLRREPVVWESGDFFRWYAGTLAAYRLNGQFWQQWRNRVLVELVRQQNGVAGKKLRRQSDMGSWDAHGMCRQAGPAYTTAMAVLTLSASYGHSPLYGSTK